MLKLLLQGMAFCLLIHLLGCNEDTSPPAAEEEYLLSIPHGFPYPDIPEDNTLTKARVALGKRLFFDPVLSVDSTISCGSCHKQEFAFADNRALSPGVEERLGFRNSPTLANVAYLQLVNKDGGVPKLDLQAMVPIEDHAEMDFSALKAAERLNSIPSYLADFEQAYEGEATAFTITRSLGAFMRILISGDSKYDQVKSGQATFSTEELAGMELFFSEQAKCSSCHSNFNFTDNSFRNNGLYQEYDDWGRKRVTGLQEDEGKFRVPTLRNIALTAPYMHDGSLPNLEAVLEHYQSGGSKHPNKDPLLQPLQLNEQEKASLIAFLNTLTDFNFIRNPEFEQ
jgi:cytochrome c peroxidase